MAAAASASSAARPGASTNVRVAVRCRPFNGREKELKSKCIIEVDDSSILIEDPKGAKEPHRFTFDHSYFWDCKQEDVYTDLGKPILDGAVAGFNGTIFAYGQTGSGKTFSMMGEPGGLEGIIPRLNAGLFDSLRAASDAASAGGATEEGGESKSAPEVDFLVSVSYLEIYNEVIKDLLNPSDKRLEVREHPKLGIYVKDLATLVVKDAESVAALIEQGNAVRQVATTNMNARSSRSHSCFIIRIEQKRTERVKTAKSPEVERTTTTNAKLNLVDLAGSERQAKTKASGARLKEGAAINKSLTALGNVINALASADRKGAHIPYRDSKLTRLLQESLGGNSMTLMLAAISPADDNFDETMSTLRYANRAKNIKNSAKRNEDVNQAIINELRGEIESLRKQLLQQQAKGPPPADADPEEAAREAARVADLEDTIAALEHAKQQSWEKQAALSAAYEEERKKNLANTDRIKSVMQTLKEDNLETLRRLKQLDAAATKETRRFRSLRDAHKANRAQMAEQMVEWQRLHELDGGREDGPHASEIASALASVERLHERVEAEQKELMAIKARIRGIDEDREEVRAEAAAQRRLLEQDADLRQTIADEERRRLAAEAETALAEKMAEQRQALQEEADRERQELLARLHAAQEGGGGASGEEVDALRLELLEARRDRAVAQLTADTARAQLDAAVERVRAEADEAAHAARVRELRMLRAVVEGYEEERSDLRKQVADMSGHLQSAAGDIEQLSRQVASLQRDLVMARAGGMA